MLKFEQVSSRGVLLPAPCVRSRGLTKTFNR